MSILLCLVLGVPDGDSLRMKCDEREKPVAVRLVEIDAPELAHHGFVRMDEQPYGKASQQALSALCYQKRATVHTTSLDRYGRTLAHVECDGVSANEAQAAAGLAWAYMPKRGSKIPALAAEARAQHRGLWADPAPIRPADWRKGGR